LRKNLRVATLLMREEVDQLMTQPATGDPQPMPRTSGRNSLGCLTGDPGG
jgi:hypothetical protein